MSVLAVVICDTKQGRLGLPAQLGDRLVGQTVLTHTVRRVARVPQVSRIVLVHPAGQDPTSLLDATGVRTPLSTFADEAGLTDASTARLVAARKWALTAWRGGLGQATVYDELLPAGPAARAAQQLGFASVLLVRADWCYLDFDYATAQIKAHLTAPESMKLVFTQAPPGLSGLVAYRETLEQLAESGSGFGTILGYNPHKPTVDPIGRDVNHPISPSVRDCYQRFIYDSPRTMAHLQRIASRLGSHVFDAGAEAITATSRAISEETHPAERLPQVVTMELTPRRAAGGPIVPQHHVTFDRPDLDVAVARRIFEQLEPDTGLILGGLGDAMLHPQWDQIVQAAHDVGVLGIGITTDLLQPPETIRRLVDLPVDLLMPRINADKAETYRQVMGFDRFRDVLEALELLFKLRQERGTLLPWIVPRMVKATTNLADLETFYERWLRVTGAAVIEPAQTGCGAVPDVSPVPMEPPLRRPCRQVGRRMTILSNGHVAMCDQDWFGHGSLGDVTQEPLLTIWQRVAQTVEQHLEGRWDEHPLCGKCSEWHRP